MSPIPVEPVAWGLDPSACRQIRLSRWPGVWIRRHDANSHRVAAGTSCSVTEAEDAFGSARISPFPGYSSGTIGLARGSRECRLPGRCWGCSRATAWPTPAGRTGSWPSSSTRTNPAAPPRPHQRRVRVIGRFNPGPVAFGNKRCRRHHSRLGASRAWKT